jgi:hypothetical protein
MRQISSVPVGLFLSRWHSTDLFLYATICAYNFIRVLIFLLPKPWILHTNTSMLYDKLRGTAVGVLCEVRGVGGGGLAIKPGKLSDSGTDSWDDSLPRF